ncbi:MAG: outer membrane beta-barrel protein [Deltaproteobacteria bacterium]|nr:outer membrane beta-barrel protein [Deltaproteobacteria bacterium]
MNSSRLARALLTFVLAILLVPSVSLAKAKIVVVFDIADSSGRFPPAALSQLTEYFATQLAQGSAFRVIPRSQVKQRLKAQKTQSYKNCYDEKCQIEVGRELSAQKLVTTRIMRVGTKCAVTSTLFDLRTSASERAASQKTVCDQDSLVVALERVAEQLKGGGGSGSSSGGITPAPAVVPAKKPTPKEAPPVVRPKKPTPAPPQPTMRPRPVSPAPAPPAPRPQPLRHRRAQTQNFNASGLVVDFHTGVSISDDETVDSGFVVGGLVGFEFRLGKLLGLSAALWINYHQWAGVVYDTTGNSLDFDVSFAEVSPGARLALYLKNLVVSVTARAGYAQLDISVPGYESETLDGMSFGGGVEAQWALSRHFALGGGFEVISADPEDVTYNDGSTGPEPFRVTTVYVSGRLKF